jgi:hypothetical protein
VKPARQEELEALCGALLKKHSADLKKEVPPNTFFAILVGDFGGSGFIAYASNAVRKDMIKALRETADKLESHDAPYGPGRKPGAT